MNTPVHRGARMNRESNASIAVAEEEPRNGVEQEGASKTRVFIAAENRLGIAQVCRTQGFLA